MKMTAVSMPCQVVRTHKAVSCPVCPGSLCSHSYSLHLFYFAACFPFGFSNTGGSSWEAHWPLSGGSTHFCLFPTSYWFPFLPLSWEKISTLGGRVLVEEFSSQALRVTTVSLSTYSRIHLLKWKRGWVVLNMFAFGLAAVLL